jgi:hypothetical protein
LDYYNTNALQIEFAFNKAMFEAHIRYINDIINDEGLLLTSDEFCNMYPQVNINFLEYWSIMNATKAWIKKGTIVIKKN